MFCTMGTGLAIHSLYLLIHSYRLAAAVTRVVPALLLKLIANYDTWCEKVKRNAPIKVVADYPCLSGTLYFSMQTSDGSVRVKQSWSLSLWSLTYLNKPEITELKSESDNIRKKI